MHGLDSQRYEDLVAIRRHLHQHPELSLQEFETANTIESQLRSWGIECERVGDTGVVALVRGAAPGPTLGYRADTDALPIEELSTHDYASKTPGVMHACGHDVHTTIGLGIAREIKQRSSELRGAVKFVFQPAEEASPVDEPIGAERMVALGVLENPAVDAMFALHCMPTLDVGHFGSTGGSVWASSDLVEISIEGKKTHAAYPHEGIDAVVVAAQVVVALQTIVARRVDTRQPTVLSIGQIAAGNTYNVIADHAKLTGILRTLSTEAGDLAKEEVSRLVRGVCEALGAKGTVHFTPGARLVQNDASVESRIVSLLKEAAGEEAVVSHLPQLGAEDFSAFSSRVPSCYLFLGVRNEARGIVHMIHTPYFDVDESAIAFGVSHMTEAMLAFAATQ